MSLFASLYFPRLCTRIHKGILALVVCQDFFIDMFVRFYFTSTRTTDIYLSRPLCHWREPFETPVASAHVVPYAQPQNEDKCCTKTHKGGQRKSGRSGVVDRRPALVTARACCVPCVITLVRRRRQQDLMETVEMWLKADSPKLNARTDENARVKCSNCELFCCPPHNTLSFF